MNTETLLLFILVVLIEARLKDTRWLNNIYLRLGRFLRRFIGGR